ncbi:MAG: substrate-binding domain-containing protein, partial [Lachnospiraceae bacterium]|nr:substrate-binding domain-containing protein [Lachnospiraceae bacterium]
MKNRSKKLACLMLTAVLALLAMSGCTPTSVDGPGVATPEEAASQQEAAAEEKQKTAAESAQPAEAETEAEEETPYSEGKDPYETLTSLIDFSGLPQFSKEDYPRVDGSTANLPLSYMLYRLSTGASQEEAERDISHSKTDFAYYSILWEERHEYSCSLLLAYEPSEEIYAEIAESGIELEFKPIGKDALVFLANESNPVTRVTKEELIDIYAGRIKNWSEVGGQDKTIQAFQRTPNSGSQTLMEKLVMQGVPMAPAPSYLVPSEMGDLIERVASYTGSDASIGYSVYFYARNMYARPGLRFMAIDGVMPSKETIMSGEYPYVNDFYAVIRKDEPADSPARQLFDFLTTDAGQQLVEALGYVPVRESGLKTDDIEGMKRLAQSFEYGDGTITLQEGETLLVNGDEVLNTGGVVMMNGAMEELERFEDLYMQRPIRIIAIEKPQVMVSKENGGYGLFDFGKKKWIVEPIYSSMYENTVEGKIYAWEENAEGEEPGRRLVLENGKMQEVTSEGTTVGGVTFYVEEGRLYYQKKGDLKRLVPAMEDRNIGYGYAAGDFFACYDADTGDQYVLNTDLEIVLDDEVLGDERIAALLPVEVENENATRFSLYDSLGDLIRGEISYDNGEEAYFKNFLYDVKNDQLLSGKEDMVDIFYGYVGNDFCYSVTGEDGETLLYDGSAKPLVAKDKKTPYSVFLGMDYYGYEMSKIVDNRECLIFRIEHVTDKEGIDLDIDELGILPQTGRAVAKDTFLFETEDGNVLLRGGEERMRGDYLYASSYGTKDAVSLVEGNDKTATPIFHVESGEQICEIPAGEHVATIE